MEPNNTQTMAGSQQAMREALKELLDAMYDMGIDEETVSIAAESTNCPAHSRVILSVIKKAKAALAAPARNCDIGTAEEQRVRFEAWCEKQPERYCKACAECPTQRYAINCFCKWAQMPYEEGGAQ